MLHFTFLLKVLNKSFIKLSLATSHTSSLFKNQFWTASPSEKDQNIPAVWCLMTFLACTTHIHLSSSFARSLFILILCVLAPASVPRRRVADSPSGLKAGCVWVNSVFLWFFFFPAFVRLLLFADFLLLTFLVLLFLRWQCVFDGINKKSFVCTSKRTFQPVKT